MGFGRESASLSSNIFSFDDAVLMAALASTEVGFGDAVLATAALVASTGARALGAVAATG